MANSVDPDQTAPSGAVWSGSALFAYAISSEALVYKMFGHLPYLCCFFSNPLLLTEHHISYIIIRFLINVQVQGQHSYQWAPFQIAGLLHAWQISHQEKYYQWWLIKLLSTLVISKSKELSGVLQDIGTLPYQICRIEEKINRTTTFHNWICHLTPEVRNILKILWKRGDIAPKRSNFSSFINILLPVVRFPC